MLFNPFVIYSLMWFGVLFLYKLDLALVYPPLNKELYIFLIITSSISLILGICLRKLFKIKKIYYQKSDLKKVKKIVLFILVFFSVEIILEGKVPLYEIVKKTGYTRHDFIGIKSLHYIMIIFTTFYCQKVISVYIYTNKKKYIIYYILLNACFAIFYLRGIIFISLFMSLIIFIINKKIYLKKICIVSFLLVYIFGIIGNIREGDKWNGNKTFIQSGVVKENIILNGPLIFGYIYFTCSLANLSLNVEVSKVKGNFKEFILENTLPEFIQSRIKIKELRKPKLILPTLNTTTTYTLAYLQLGFLGMYILYSIYVIVVIFFASIILKRTNYKNELLSVLFSIMFFTFFTNTLVFSIISFQLVFPFIDCIFNRLIKNFFKQIKKYNFN